jgi:hypothetical protein
MPAKFWKSEIAVLRELSDEAWESEPHGVLEGLVEAFSR